MGNIHQQQCVRACSYDCTIQTAQCIPHCVTLLLSDFSALQEGEGEEKKCFLYLTYYCISNPYILT